MTRREGEGEGEGERATEVGEGGGGGGELGATLRFAPEIVAGGSSSQEQPVAAGSSREQAGAGGPAAERRAGQSVGAPKAAGSGQSRTRLAGSFQASAAAAGSEDEALGSERGLKVCAESLLRAEDAGEGRRSRGGDGRKSSPMASPDAQQRLVHHQAAVSQITNAAAATSISTGEGGGGGGGGGACGGGRGRRGGGGGGGGDAGGGLSSFSSSPLALSSPSPNHPSQQLDSTTTTKATRTHSVVVEVSQYDKGGTPSDKSNPTGPGSPPLGPPSSSSPSLPPIAPITPIGTTIATTATAHVGGTVTSGRGVASVPPLSPSSLSSPAGSSLSGALVGCHSSSVLNTPVETSHHRGQHQQREDSPSPPPPPLPLHGHHHQPSTDINRNNEQQLTLRPPPPPPPPLPPPPHHHEQQFQEQQSQLQQQHYEAAGPGNDKDRELPSGRARAGSTGISEGDGNLDTTNGDDEEEEARSAARTPGQSQVLASSSPDERSPPTAGLSCSPSPALHGSSVSCMSVSPLSPVSPISQCNTALVPPATPHTSFATSRSSPPILPHTRKFAEFAAGTEAATAGGAAVSAGDGHSASVSCGGQGDFMTYRPRKATRFRECRKCHQIISAGGPYFKQHMRKCDPACDPKHEPYIPAPGSDETAEFPQLEVPAAGGIIFSPLGVFSPGNIAGMPNECGRSLGVYTPGNIAVSVPTAGSANGLEAAVAVPQQQTAPSRGFLGSQKQQLDIQLQIFSYLKDGLPVPEELIQLLKNTPTQNDGWMGPIARRQVAGRCRRTDGKSWCCPRPAIPGQKYCEKHMHRGRLYQKIVPTTAGGNMTAESAVEKGQEGGQAANPCPMQVDQVQASRDSRAMPMVKVEEAGSVEASSGKCMLLPGPSPGSVPDMGTSGAGGTDMREVPTQGGVPAQGAVAGPGGVPAQGAGTGQGGRPGTPAGKDGAQEIETCRRTDGKKWKCTRACVPGQKYCEKHVNRGKQYHRKVAMQNQAAAEARATGEQRVLQQQMQGQEGEGKRGIEFTVTGLQGHVQGATAMIVPAETYYRWAGLSPGTTMITSAGGAQVLMGLKGPIGLGIGVGGQLQGGLFGVGPVQIMPGQVVIHGPVGGVTMGPSGLDAGGGSKRDRDPGEQADLRPGRCRRTDGKKWFCSKPVVPGQKYCERHLHRGKQWQAAEEAKQNRVQQQQQPQPQQQQQQQQCQPPPQQQQELLQQAQRQTVEGEAQQHPQPFEHQVEQQQSEQQYPQVQALVKVEVGAEQPQEFQAQQKPQVHVQPHKNQLVLDGRLLVPGELGQVHRQEQNPGMGMRQEDLDRQQPRHFQESGQFQVQRQFQKHPALQDQQQGRTSKEHYPRETMRGSISYTPHADPTTAPHHESMIVIWQPHQQQPPINLSPPPLVSSGVAKQSSPPQGAMNPDPSRPKEGNATAAGAELKRRCCRTDGKRWVCSNNAVAGSKYCEKHVNRGRTGARPIALGGGGDQRPLLPAVPGSFVTSKAMPASQPVPSSQPGPSFSSAPISSSTSMPTSASIVPPPLLSAANLPPANASLSLASLRQWALQQDIAGYDGVVREGGVNASSCGPTMLPSSCGAFSSMSTTTSVPNVDVPSAGNTGPSASLIACSSSPSPLTASLPLQMPMSGMSSLQMVDIASQGFVMKQQDQHASEQGRFAEQQPPSPSPSDANMFMEEEGAGELSRRGDVGDLEMQDVHDDEEDEDEDEDCRNVMQNVDQGGKQHPFHGLGSEDRSGGGEEWARTHSVVSPSTSSEAEGAGVLGGIGGEDGCGMLGKKDQQHSAAVHPLPSPSSASELTPDFSHFGMSSMGLDTGRSGSFFQTIGAGHGTGPGMTGVTKPSSALNTAVSVSTGANGVPTATAATC
ncbi:hypothetical protein CBR_g3467 [Chara braunii]|uniref:WRC domain-containing protein n=1 Tax=Chara braunii TaxID=69332 RepID=A0A388JQY9_CHABU|nr:hypothetical protein CBR_g3467 [Chara braunii]|eukprot:GBG60224.1 hypothetical protein CBR_g3467 [Chara braunii]